MCIIIVCFCFVCLVSDTAVHIVYVTRHVFFASILDSTEHPVTTLSGCLHR